MVQNIIISDSKVFQIVYLIYWCKKNNISFEIERE